MRIGCSNSSVPAIAFFLLPAYILCRPAAIGPGRYKAVIADTSLKLSGLIDLATLRIPLFVNWKIPAKAPVQNTFLSTFMSSRSMLSPEIDSCTSADVRLVLIAIRSSACLITCNVANPRISNLTKPIFPRFLLTRPSVNEACVVSSPVPLSRVLKIAVSAIKLSPMMIPAAWRPT